jgi:hypothetical protein
MWSLLWGIIFHIIWTKRNGNAFKNESWPTNEKQKFIWDALVGYERVEWVKCMKLCKHVHIEEMKHFKKLEHAQGDMW